MKKFILICTILTMVLGFPLNTYGASIFTIGSTNYTVDKSARTMDIYPYLKNDRILLPLRFAAIATGVSEDNIFWDASAQTVILIKGSTVTQFKIGNETMLINGKPVYMDVAPEIFDGRTMLPGRYLAQALGIDIQYNAYNQTITFGEIPQTTQSNIPLNPYPLKPSNETVPSLTYNNSVDKVNKNFEWKYNGITYDWYVEAPKNLLVWDRQINQLVNKFYLSNGYTQAAILQQIPEEFQRMILSQTEKGEGNYTYWAKEDTNSQWAASLGDRLNTAAQADGYDYFYKAEFILSFVGSAIPYQVTPYPELPGQTVFDNGDCKDKSILLADILKSLGYQIALLHFPGTTNNPGHMALGINFNDNQIPPDRNVSYYTHNGRKYYFAETTEPNWLLGQPSKNIPAYVYEIN